VILNWINIKKIKKCATLSPKIEIKTTIEQSQPITFTATHMNLISCNVLRGCVISSQSVHGIRARKWRREQRTERRIHACARASRNARAKLRGAVERCNTRKRERLHFVRGFFCRKRIARIFADESRWKQWIKSGRECQCHEDARCTPELSNGEDFS